MTQSFHLTVNGSPVTVEIDPDTSLLHVLRNELNLLGTRFGCGMGQCGACFVILDGGVVPSCDTPMWSAEGKTVVTVEGLGAVDQGERKVGITQGEGPGDLDHGEGRGGSRLHRAQQAILDAQAAQCAFCISGIAVNAAALVDANPEPTEAEIVETLDRNLCRCGVHRRLVQATHAAGGMASGTGMREAGFSPGTSSTSGGLPGRLTMDLGSPPWEGGGRPPTTNTNTNATSQPPLSRHVTVEPDGTITIRIGKVEIGQGIVTALSQIAADALNVSPHQVRMLPASTRYGPDEGFTAGSLSIATSGPTLRKACAQARRLFVAEAARRWGVAPAEIVVQGGRITCKDLATSYSEMAQAVDLDVPLNSEAAGGESTGRIGESLPRLDLPAKIAGRPAYIHDLRLPGTLFGRVLRPPSPGATLLRYDASRLEGLDVQVVRDGSFIGVITPDEAESARAVTLLRDNSEWDERDTLPNEDDLHDYLRSGLHQTVELPPKGDAPTEGRTLRASYSRPFIAHASMAPSCAASRWNDDGTVSVWTHSQGIHPLRNAIAQTLGLDESHVQADHVEGAGCYGHNAADDVALDAVLLARAVPGRPVLAQWSRHDELTWAPFGSAMSADVTAVVDETTGHIKSWEYELWSQGHASRPGFAGAPGLLAGAHLEHPLHLPAAADPPLERGGGSLRNAVPIYDFPHRRITGHRLLETPIRSSALRSLGAFMNVFAIESFMDELAEATGTDPLEYRLAHLKDERARAVLQRAAEASGWGTPTPEDTGRGIAFARYKSAGAYCAVVADVEAGQRIRVHRLTIAVDVGQVINPDGVRNQIEGGAIQATSWTLKERVRFDRRRITSDDWESYPILRFSETPQVAVEIVESPGAPSIGAGEAAQGPTAAAIANAVTNALDGVRVRDLPLTPEAVIAAIG